MLCQNCLKNQSNYHFTKIVNGNKSEYHLCESCAREKGDIIQGPGNSFSIHNLLSGMLNIEFGPATAHVQQAETKCGTCGMTFRQFSKKGRFGCAECYSAFANQLEPVIRRVQSNNTMHHGKVPANRTQEQVNPFEQVTQQLAKLEQELQTEIQNEQYERAAVLRDRITNLRKKLNQQVAYKQWPHFDAGEGV
jgi:protein arginine kinase activator